MQKLFKYRNKLLLLAFILFGISIYIQNLYIGKSSDDWYAKGASLLSYNDGITDPNKNSPQSLSTIKNFSSDGFLLKDNNGNIMSLNAISNLKPEIKVLTLKEGDDTSNYNFDSSYYYSYPRGNRTITYIAQIANNQGVNLSYICLGGNLKVAYDGEKPVTKEGCIAKAKEAANLRIKELYSLQDYTLKAIEKEKNEEEKIANLKAQLSNVKPLYYSNGMDCYEGKTLYRDFYINNGYAFDTVEQCFSYTDNNKKIAWWNNNRYTISGLVIFAAFALSIPFILYYFLFILSKLIPSISNGIINFLGRASDAMNKEKKIKIDATINIKKDE